MNMTLDDVPRKCIQASRPGLAMSYPQSYELYQNLADQDPSILFYALRPLGDELWNMVDGHRSIGVIVESCLLEFDFDVEPTLLLPVFEGLKSEGLIVIEGK